MAKFIFLYSGPATQMEQMTEEQSNAAMAKWGVWIEKLGPALVDVDNPMANGTS